MADPREGDAFGDDFDEEFEGAFDDESGDEPDYFSDDDPDIFGSGGDDDEDDLDGEDDELAIPVRGEDGDDAADALPGVTASSDDEDDEDDGMPNVIPGAPLTREQFITAVIARVRRKFPLVKIGRSPQPFSVRLDGHTASLENLYRLSKLKPDALRHQIERWAVELLRAGEGSPDQMATFDDLRDRILPMVLAVEELPKKKKLPGDEEDFSELIEPAPVKKAGKIQGKSPRTPVGRLSDMATQPLVPGLRTAYVIDGDRTIVYVTRERLDRLGVDLYDLHEQAMQNLVARSDQMHAHAAQDPATQEVNLVLFQSLDGFDASRLLLPNLHERLREHLGSPFVAAVPNRDILLCFRNDPDTVDSLRSQIRHDFRTMPHQITEKLLLVTPDGIAPYD